MKIVDTKTRLSKSGSRPGVRVKRTGRRTYTAEYKHSVVQACDEPGVSVAGVALTHRINANLVRRWIVRHNRESAAKSPTVLLPVSVQPASPVSGADHGVSTATTNRRRAGAAAIEIEAYGVRIYLRGSVDAHALRGVLDVLWQR